MLQEKRKDLDGEKKRRLLERLVGELSHANPDLYYRSTDVIASEVQAYAQGPAGLINEEKDLLRDLTTRDIAVLLSLH